MKDNEVRELVNRITEVARKYHDTEQLRERIAQEIRPIVKDQPGHFRFSDGIINWGDVDAELMRIANKYVGTLTRNATAVNVGEFMSDLRALLRKVSGQ
jgi:hypothetical protein